MPALATSPADPRVVYAATEVAGMFRSADGGRTWEKRDAAVVPDDRPVYDLAVDPHRPDTVYAATYGSGLPRSDDGGAHWMRRL